MCMPAPSPQYFPTAEGPMKSGERAVRECGLGARTSYDEEVNYGEDEDEHKDDLEW